MAITPEFLFDFESRMSTITETEYNRLQSNLWWPKVTKVRPSGSSKEVVQWLLSTGSISPQGKGGNLQFQDIVANVKEFENRAYGAGLRLERNQLTDLDGNGVDLAGHWSRQMGAYMAYFPQRRTAMAMLNGTAANSKAYDGLPFFHTAHALNPYDSSVGTFANRFTGSASGSYPGACPIDTTNAPTIDVALENLGKIMAYIRGIPMPNGQDPRYLNPRFIIGAPRLATRLQQLTNARFIAQAAASGGGSGDIEAIISNWGLEQPIMAREIGANSIYPLDEEDGGGSVQGSDTTFYVACEETATSELGALTYVQRENFEIKYYTGNGGSGIDADLDRRNEFEYLLKGRSVLGYGHPYLLFRCEAT